MARREAQTERTLETQRVFRKALLERSQLQVVAELTAVNPGPGSPMEGLLRTFRHIHDHRREYQALLRVEAVAKFERRMVTNAIHSLALWWLELEPPVPAEEAALLTLGLLKNGLASLAPR
ncbi:MAG: hypothetical protein WCG80_08350 [Spirochaetales bacterium]